jgi:hypothetical protein
MKLFLSHVSNESPLAVVLKERIEKAFDGQFEIFVSSTIVDLPAGTEWLKSLEKALAEADALIVLCSRHSVTKPWVMFESGGAWVKKIPIIPICHSGQKKNTLPSPLSFFQGLEVVSPQFVHDLLKSLSKLFKLKVSTSVDQGLIWDAIKASIKKIKKPSKADGPFTKDPKPRRQLELGLKDANILKKIATSNDESCTCKKLATSLKMRANDLDVHLRYLIDQKFVTKKTIKDGDPLYHTTKAGLSYLIQNKLI